MKVLLADDNPTDRSLEKAMLRALGFYLIDKAADGAEAWRKIQTAAAAGVPYDLVITDWKMPQLNGLSLLEALRNDKRFLAIPVILLTSVADEDSIVKAALKGATDYILKPIDLEIMRSKLGRFKTGKAA